MGAGERSVRCGERRDSDGFSGMEGIRSSGRRGRCGGGRSHGCELTDVQGRSERGEGAKEGMERGRGEPDEVHAAGGRAEGGRAAAGKVSRPVSEDFLVSSSALSCVV